MQPAFDPVPGITAMERSTDSLLSSVSDFGEHEVRAESWLPDWTRGHVLAHIARNAEGMINLLTWARTGVETPMYGPGDARDRDIEAGAGRSAAELLADLVTTADELADAARAHPEDRWHHTVRLPGDRVREAGQLLQMRRTELEIHHVDLCCGYSPADWPEDWAAELLGQVVDTFAARADSPAFAMEDPESERRWALGQPEGAPVVGGPVRELLAWLTGRGDGAGLTVTPPGPLPTVGRWI